jgi:hypothetical protein
MKPSAEETREQGQTERCPACGSRDVLTIVYGLIEPGDFAGQNVWPGGCCVSDDDPAWRCACGHTWGQTQL